MSVICVKPRNCRCCQIPTLPSRGLQCVKTSSYRNHDGVVIMSVQSETIHLEGIEEHFKRLACCLNFFLSLCCSMSFERGRSCVFEREKLTFAVFNPVTHMLILAIPSCRRDNLTESHKYDPPPVNKCMGKVREIRPQQTQTG